MSPWPPSKSPLLARPSSLVSSKRIRTGASSVSRKNLPSPSNHPIRLAIATLLWGSMFSTPNYSSPSSLPIPRIPSLLTILARTFFLASSLSTVSSPTTSSTKTARKLSIGATLAHLTPITKPTWTSLACRQCSTSTTSIGLSAAGSTSIPPQNSSLPMPTAWAPPLTPSLRVAPYSPAAASRTVSSATTSASIAIAKSPNPSSTITSTSAATPASDTPSSTATSICPNIQKLVSTWKPTAAASMSLPPASSWSFARSPSSKSPKPSSVTLSRECEPLP